MESKSSFPLTPRLIKFKVTIKKVNNINLEELSRFMSTPRDWNSVSDVDYPFEAVTALEILLKHSPANRFVSFGRKSGGGSFFSKESLGMLEFLIMKGELPGGLALHNGWYQNVKIAEGHFVAPSARPGMSSMSISHKFKLLMNMDIKYFLVLIILGIRPFTNRDLLSVSSSSSSTNDGQKICSNH